MGTASSTPTTGDWIQLVDRGDGTEPEPMWREDRIAALLDGHTDGALFVAGTVMNQGRFRPRFDAVVLLSAPLDVVLARVAHRPTNPFGKSAGDRARIVADVAEVEPLLRAGASVEIDTRAPLSEVADRLEAIAREAVVAPAVGEAAVGEAAVGEAAVGEAAVGEAITGVRPAGPG